MKHMGFPDKWLQWLSLIFASSYSSKLLNGVPGKNFKCNRGVINDACTNGLLRLPIQAQDSDFPMVQYADDTLLIMQADSTQLQYFKALVNDFAMSTGLKVNFNKYIMIPINVTDDKTSSLAVEFGCQIGSMPFTYLDLSMGTTKPRF
jgi:hypothetical protein